MVISTFELKKYKKNYHQIHKDIMSMFGCNRGYQNVLFMLIGDKLIVQSDCPPKYVNESLQFMNSKNCDNFLNAIHDGDIIKIFAIYEPTKCKKRNGKSSAKISIKDENERKFWVKRKFVQSGTVLEINEIAKNVKTVKKDDGNNHIVFTYEYEFLLKVKSADELRKMIKFGVGRSKSYGAGMSLVMGGVNV